MSSLMSLSSPLELWLGRSLPKERFPKEEPRDLLVFECLSPNDDSPSEGEVELPALRFTIPPPGRLLSKVFESRRKSIATCSGDSKFSSSSSVGSAPVIALGLYISLNDKLWVPLCGDGKFKFDLSLWGVKLRDVLM